jgi:ribosome biogenesis protein YTM1
MDHKKEPHILVRFVTDHDSYRVSDNPFSVPSNLGRSGLSEVLNHLLELDEFVSFDFLVNDRLLRSSLVKFIQFYQITTEDILNIKYFPARNVSEEIQSSEAESWISSIDVLNADYAAAGCYDGSLLIFNPSDLSTTVKQQCHEDPINSLLLWEESSNSSNVRAATCSKDNLIKIWEVNSEKKSVTLMHHLKGHVNSVESISRISLPSSDDDILLSGDWNGNLFGWKLSKISNSNKKGESEQSKKKRKLSEGNIEEKIDFKPFFTKKAHGQSLSSIYCNSSFSSVLTSSWDHSFKQWDLDKLDSIVSVNCSKVITSLDCNSSNLVATSHPDSKIRIWDLRSKETSNVPMISLGKSSNWISQVGSILCSFCVNFMFLFF